MKITILGGGGFLGRRVAQKLAEAQSALHEAEGAHPAKD